MDMEIELIFIYNWGGGGGFGLFLKLFNEVASLTCFGSTKAERSLPCGKATFDQVQVASVSCGSAMDLWI